jgi:hypothetical protein
MDRFLSEKRELLGKRSSVDLRRMFSSEGAAV